MFSLQVNKKKLKKIFNSKLPLINIGTNDEVSIRNLSKLIAKYSNYNGKIVFDKKSPDGTFRKNLDTTIMKKLG